MATLLKSNKCFGGTQYKFKHASSELKCEMTFSVFVPGQAQAPSPPPPSAITSFPVLYYLSGLTCTDDNVVQKSGIQRAAARCNVAVVCPDTSPRGLGYPGEDDSWDFGTGAGFYVNATTSPWKEGYRMDAYVTSELPAVLAATEELRPILNLSKASIMGHSMGGHGALVLSLRNPGMYASVSAFAPICHPSVVPWGRKAFGGYLGDDEEAWRGYDACALVSGYTGEKIEVLLDTGTADEFLEEQLRVEDLVEAAAGNDRVAVTSRMNECYDHSYFTIATFVEDHVEFHAARLL